MTSDSVAATCSNENARPSVVRPFLTPWHFFPSASDDALHVPARVCAMARSHPEHTLRLFRVVMACPGEGETRARKVQRRLKRYWGAAI